ncbi:MAG: NlpC/P60 family protein [Beijerinckiaceae bacterium]
MTNAHRQRIVAEARRWLGTPYAHQASVCGVGCDCLGLVRGVWRALYGSEPEKIMPYAPDWALSIADDRMRDAAHRHLCAIPLDEADAGDVILFRWRAHLPASHAAILSNTRTMIHAHDGAAIAEVAVSAWWRRHAVAGFAFPVRPLIFGETV